MARTWTALTMLSLLAACAAIDSKGKCGNGEDSATCKAELDEAVLANMNLLQTQLKIQVADKDIDVAEDVASASQHDGANVTGHPDSQSLRHSTLDERFPHLTMSVVAITSVLAVWSCWKIFSVVSQSKSGLSLGISTTTQAMIWAGYVCLATSHMFFQERAGATQYSVISATLLVYLGKATVSLVMFICKGDMRVNLDSDSGTYGKWTSIFLLMASGGAFACYDALSFLVLRDLDPATYQVLLHMRVVFISILWQVVFNKKLSGMQCQALVLLVIAGMTKVLGRATVLDSTALGYTLCMMLVQCTLCAFANVWSEALLKDAAKMPTDLVNTIIYSWGLFILTLLLVCSQGVDTLYKEFFAPVAWAKLQGDSWMIASICSLIVLGVVTAYLLKHLSNIVKEMSGAFVIVASTVLERAIVPSAATTKLDMLGIVLAVLSIGVYSSDPQRNPPAPPAAKKASSDSDL